MLELNGTQSFLTVGWHAPGGHCVRIVQTFKDAIGSWTALTRLSPIFGTRRSNETRKARSAEAFNGVHHLLFVGPADPLNVASLIPPEAELWLSLGAFNCVLHMTRSPSRVVKMLQDEKIRWEHWYIRNGNIREVEFAETRERDSKWRPVLQKLTPENLSGELIESAREYAALMASTLSRCEHIVPELIGDISETNRQIMADLEAATADDHFVTLAEMTDVNAALSRFTSQAFSGTSPILNTESHFWTHSLLGTGVANFALRSVERYVRRRLGEERLTIRLEWLERRGSDVVDLNKLGAQDRFWQNDFLEQAQLTDADREKPLFPIITYLSGRDGFKSTETTLSAALAVISASNSVRWTLMTLTHEISHIFVKGFLALLYFDAADPKELRRVRTLWNQHSPASNLLEEIRRYLVHALKEMEGAEAPRLSNTKTDVAIILDRWHGEIEEIFASVFDFMYFYGGDEELYVSTIWSSWGVLPNIDNRVPEYVVRTLAVLMVPHLGDPTPEDRARESLTAIFAKFETRAKPRHQYRYISEAARYLRQEWKKEIKRRLRARKRLVRIASTFFFSERIATRFLSEAELAGGARRRAGYRLVPLQFDGSKVLNPLKMLQSYTDNVDPDPARSAWMLSVLAFNVESS